MCAPNDGANGDSGVCVRCVGALQSPIVRNQQRVGGGGTLLLVTSFSVCCSAGADRRAHTYSPLATKLSCIKSSGVSPEQTATTGIRLQRGVIARAEAAGRPTWVAATTSYNTLLLAGASASTPSTWEQFQSCLGANYYYLN